MNPKISKTSVTNYHYWLRNNPEERSSHLLCGERLEARQCSISLAAARHWLDSATIFLGNRLLNQKK
jgi:hypothetical protein